MSCTSPVISSFLVELPRFNLFRRILITLDFWQSYETISKKVTKTSNFNCSVKFNDFNQQGATVFYLILNYFQIIRDSNESDQKNEKLKTTFSLIFWNAISIPQNIVLLNF